MSRRERYCAPWRSAPFSAGSDPNRSNLADDELLHELYRPAQPIDPLAKLSGRHFSPPDEIRQPKTPASGDHLYNQNKHDHRDSCGDPGNAAGWGSGDQRKYQHERGERAVAEFLDDLINRNSVVVGGALELIEHVGQRPRPLLGHSPLLKHGTELPERRSPLPETGTIQVAEDWPYEYE